MGNELTKWQGAIANSERKFQEIVAAVGTPVSWQVESMFAYQIVSANDFLMKVTEQNPASLRDAIINVASVGLTLNPSLALAYLIPRNGKCCLDISYKGLIKLATDTGAVVWVRTDLVYKKDKFVYHGPADRPLHEADVFSGDRGEVVGIYCMAKTADGDFLTEVMTIEEINKVRDTSMSWAKKKEGPWKDWPGEMAKKTIIKRSSKTWPRTERSIGFNNAIGVLNEEHEIISGQEYIESPAVTWENDIDDKASETMDPVKLQEWFDRRIKSFLILSESEQKQVKSYLKQIVDTMEEDISKDDTTLSDIMLSCPLCGLQVNKEGCQECPGVKTCKVYNGEKK